MVIHEYKKEYWIIGGKEGILEVFIGWIYSFPPIQL